MDLTRTREQGCGSLSRPDWSNSCVGPDFNSLPTLCQRKPMTPIACKTGLFGFRTSRTRTKGWVIDSRLCQFSANLCDVLRLGCTTLLEKMRTLSSERVGYGC